MTKYPQNKHSSVTSGGESKAAGAALFFVIPRTAFMNYPFNFAAVVHTDRKEVT
jgi:hypothetical protein